MRVLIVEDSQNLRETIAMVLRESGYAVDESGDGKEGLWKAQSYPYDAIILDIMLPGLDGLSVLRQLRKEDNQSQILVLSAKDTINDRVKGNDFAASFPTASDKSSSRRGPLQKLMKTYSGPVPKNPSNSKEPSMSTNPPST